MLRRQDLYDKVLIPMEIYHQLNLTLGQYVQVYLGYKVLKFQSGISRNKTEKEQDLELVRPWQISLPKCICITTSGKLSLNLKVLLDGAVVRAGCVVSTPFGKIQVLNVVVDGKSQDALVNQNTEFIISPEQISPVTSAIRDASLKSLLDIIDFMRNYSKSLNVLSVELPKGILIHGPPGVGKTSLVVQAARISGTKLQIINGHDVFSQVGAGERYLRESFGEAKEYCNSTNLPCIVFIDEIDSIAPPRHEVKGETGIVAQLLVLMDGLESRGKLIVIGATNRPNSLDPALRRPGRFDREIFMKPPNEQARYEILSNLLTNFQKDLDLNYLSKITNGYVGADLVSLCREVTISKMSRKEGIITTRDFVEAAEKAGTPSLLRSSGQSLVETSDWSQIGGLEKLKSHLSHLVEWPLLHPNSFQRLGLHPPKGILLYGPPGCSKTTLIKIIASKTGSCFLQLSGASMYSSLVGESESIIRTTFQTACSCAPSIIFIDEIDTLVGKRNMNNGAVGDPVQERILSTLLNEMDGIINAESVLVLAATNRPDMIDTALLRPGRFDKILYVGPPKLEERIQILELVTKKSTLHDNVDFQKLAELTDRFTGADLKSLYRETVLLALRQDRTIEKLEMHHFLQALEGTRPTISNEMLEQYQLFKQQYGGYL